MKLFHIALKDLTRSMRSLFAVGMMVGAPLLLTGMFFFAFGGASGEESTPPTLQVAVVNLDQPVAGQPALGELLADMFSDPSVSGWMQAADYADEAAARSAVDDQTVGTAVIIPADLSSSIFSGGQAAPVRLIQDPTLTIGPLVVKNMINSFFNGINGGQIAIKVASEQMATQGASLTSAQMQSVVADYSTWFATFQRTLYHSPDAAVLLQSPATAGEEGEAPSSNPMALILPLILVGQMIFWAFFTGGFSMMSILTEHEEGTLARIFTTPTDRTLILGGKFLAVMLTVIVQSAVLILVGKALFGVDWGRLDSLALAVLCQVIAATGLGVLLISLVKNTRQGGAIMGGGLAVLGMAGGLFTVGMPNSPAALQSLALFLPHGWLMRVWRLTITGSPPGELTFAVLVALAWGVVMFGVGAFFFRRRFA